MIILQIKYFYFLIKYYQKSVQGNSKLKIKKKSKKVKNQKTINFEP